MIGKTTEKAIKAWLALPEDRRDCKIVTDKKGPSVWLIVRGESQLSVYAEFTIASIVAKRYPKRKKVKK